MNPTILEKDKKQALIASLAILLIGGGFYWYKKQSSQQTQSLYSGNGRIEAVEIQIATKLPGRLESVNVEEGALVKAGDVLAVMDAKSLQAQLLQAKAQLLQADAAYVAAKNRAKRSAELVKEGASSQQEVDDDQARVKSTAAAVEVAKATIERLQVDIDDSTLLSPRDGRVQFKVAEPGEVLGSGGRILTVLDLTDVYMTFFLPTEAIGRLAIGSEARIVLDALKDRPIKAIISFISDEAQFTPKSVETSNEREKLMFRVKAKIPIELLKRHIEQVKTGLPGVAYVKLDNEMPWPANLNTNVIE